VNLIAGAGYIVVQPSARMFGRYQVVEQKFVVVLKCARERLVIGPVFFVCVPKCLGGAL
jgi:hypothetical protein